MIAKKHVIDYRVILAVCDEEHLGKEYEDGEICFKVSEKFFKGKKVSESELEELLIEADSINLFGNKCVELIEKKGWVSSKQIIKINGVKHAQVYRI